MKKLFFLIPASFLFLFLNTGCDLEGESANDLVNQASTDTNAGVSASSGATSSSDSDSDSGSSSSSGGGGGGGFLWKPTSESNGNLVVLLPASTRGRTQQVCTISGAFGSESASMRHEHHNGGRPHFYFSKPGGAYGTNITVQAPLTDGSVFSTVVANGASRTEQ